MQRLTIVCNGFQRFTKVPKKCKTGEICKIKVGAAQEILEINQCRCHIGNHHHHHCNSNFRILQLGPLQAQAAKDFLFLCRYGVAQEDGKEAMNQGKFRVEIRLRHSVHTMGLRSISCVGRVVVLVAAAIVARAARAVHRGRYANCTRRYAERARDV